MRRLGIFCFFDKEGVADLYLDYLLADLFQNVDQLIVVVNGIVNASGLEMFKKYTEKIVIRENRGFDAGAYKKVLVEILGKSEVKKWDEIVLCNDTFYGPFIPFEEIFYKMQQKEIDFWGLNYIENDFLSHIQSYFLVFRKKILISEDLFDYFSNNINMETEDLTDVYAFFEIGLFSYLKKRGYKFSVYSCVENYDIYRSAGVCTEIYQFPILKKRCFSSSYYEKRSLSKLLQYLQVEKKYDISLIISNIYRLYNVKMNIDEILNCVDAADEYIWRKVPRCIGKSKIIDFIQKYPQIYIYGTGSFAMQIFIFLYKYIQYFQGFIVSNGQKIKKNILYDYPVSHYKEIKEGSAIILGMSLYNSKTVIPYLKKEDKVLFLWEELIC